MKDHFKGHITAKLQFQLLANTVIGQVLACPMGVFFLPHARFRLIPSGSDRIYSFTVPNTLLL